MAGEFGQAMLQLRFFGPFALTIGPLTIPAPRIKKIVPLLALLTLRAGRDVDRSFLAGMLWQDSTEDGASLNLRRLLSDARDYLGPEAERLETPSRGRLRFTLDSALADVLQFDAAVKRWEYSCDLAAAEEAVALHNTGRLLEGFDDEWIVAERSAREWTCLRLLDTLAADGISRSDLARAERYARQALALDPLREPAVFVLCRAQSKAGDTPAALRTYEAFRDQLLRHARQKPGAEITAFIEQLRSPTPTAPAPSFPTPRRQTIPVYLTPIVGRASENIAIEEHLTSRKTRLLTLLGTGGIGKTRLATTALQQEAIQKKFSDRIFFVSLAPLPRSAAPEAIWQAIVDTFGVSPGSDETIEAVVFRALDHGSALVVLDNAEHVADSAAQVAVTLLGNLPALHFLVTSRIPLEVPGECIVPITPLPPEDAVQLLTERVRAARPQLSAPESATLIGELCKKLDYLPLALELVAVRLRSIPLHRAVDLLQDRFRLLATDSAVLPARQRRMEETVAWSVNLLSPRERTTFAVLSVFPGGFIGEMASTVADADDFVLSNLVDASLLTLDNAGRYHMLDTIRAYAANRLTEMSEAQEKTWQRFAEWGRRLTATADEEFWGRKAAYWTERLQAERANLLSAIALADAATGLLVMQGLYQFWWRRAEWSEGLSAINAVLAKPDIATADSEHVLEARTYREHYRRHLGLPHTLETHLREYIDYTLQDEKPVTAIYLCYSLSDVLAERGAFADAWEQIQLGLRLARNKSDNGLLAYVLRGACRIALHRGNMEDAYAAGEESVSIFRVRKITTQLAQSVHDLGMVCTKLCRYQQASDLLTEALDLARAQKAEDLEADALCSLITNARASGDKETATRYLSQASALLHTHYTPRLAARLQALVA